MASPILTFRDAIRERSPRWLRGTLGEKILYAFAAVFDALIDSTVQAVRRRFPGYNDDALPYLARDRKIRRGPNELSANYALRLRRWLTDHATRGGPYALLGQLAAYYAVAPFNIALRYESGALFKMSTDGVILRAPVPADPFDGDTAKWARWWLIYDWPFVVIDDGTWVSAGTYDDGGVWDSGLSAADVESLRIVPSEWNAGHTIANIILLNGGAELWDYPIGLWSDPGNWNDGAQATIAVP